MNSTDSIPLTSAEVGKLWAAYEGNSMAVCVLKYFLKNVEDSDIKSLLELALHNSESYVKMIKDIFTKEKFPIPVAFTDEDVNLNAPRLYSDRFYLNYLKYDVKAGMSVYSIAVPLMARLDLSEFFTKCLLETTDLCNRINQTLLSKGLFVRPPVVPVPEKVEFLSKQSFLNGYFEHVRPLQVLSIAHLYDNIQNSALTKAKQMGFSQVAKSQQAREYFLKAKSISDKQIDVFSSLLTSDDLPAPSSLDDEVTGSTVAPFSDKLMLFHTVESATMRARTYGNSLSFNARHDVAVTYARLLTEVGNLAEDGVNIMIDHQMLEKPPSAADRELLTTKA